VIDAVLADFRRWLEELAGEPGALVPGAPGASAPGSPAVDLATLVAAFTALRHEVNLQTKATRVQSEQFAAALEAMQRPVAANGDDANRPLVKAVAEAYDTLTRTTAEIDRLRAGPNETRWFWQKLFRRRAENIDRLVAAVTGLRMSERRVERLMSEVSLEKIETVGRPFDPETMEAVEAVAAAEHAPGTVVEEVRRGYRWRGRVFRFAQVRVAN
jgi:molecular chaperone GrpE